MAKKHQVYINNVRIYCCNTCHSHLISQDNIISRAFQGRHGPAYFVDHIVNITIGAKEERMLMTGMHTVADISCTICQTKLGWKYLHAFESNQKYKENKCILERAKISKEVFWD
ncbi:yippee-like protein [Absidia repens]|uniref:Protein yippee-like n=1 Tax=Absidia repens TaxID=90262 RepID=A0A1X2IPS6_9FUNG|nr:yippee-like protein [Absidia repens]